MPFLTIAGVTYEVQVAGATEQERIRFGSQTWSFAAKLRSQVRMERRHWSFVTVPITEAALTTLRAAVALGRTVACAGDAIGGSVNCSVLIRDVPYTRDREIVMRLAALILTETGTDGTQSAAVAFAGIGSSAFTAQP